MEKEKDGDEHKLRLLRLMAEPAHACPGPERPDGCGGKERALAGAPAPHLRLLLVQPVEEVGCEVEEEIGRKEELRCDERHLPVPRMPVPSPSLPAALFMIVRYPVGTPLVIGSHIGGVKDKYRQNRPGLSPESDAIERPIA